MLLVIREIDLSGETAAAGRRASISSQLAHGHIGIEIRTMCSHWRVCTGMESDRSGGVADVEPLPHWTVCDSRGTPHICIRRYHRLYFRRMLYTPTVRGYRTIPPLRGNCCLRCKVLVHCL
jgi:hypothetical protein